jgi:hydroxypyruvate reductase
MLQSPAPIDTRTFLRQLYDTAVAAAQPHNCLANKFPPPPEAGRLIVIAAGKAAAGMALAAERHYDSLGALRILEGVAITRYGYGLPLAKMRLIEAGHPVPDDNSVRGADAAIALASSAGENDLVLVLMSGGASALLVAPEGQITLAEKQAVTRALLKSGAPIREMNCVRKHLSRVKGGRLAQLAQPAEVVTLAISDVPGDLPDTIGSGPTSPDNTTREEAIAIINRYGIEVPASVMAVLENPALETPKPSDAVFQRCRFELAATGRDSLEAAAEAARRHGFEVILLGDAIEGEAREVAEAHAALAMRLQSERRRSLILSGGELTVTVRGDGVGGPNQEYALALAMHLDGAPYIAALAADTDGTDGGTGSAGDAAGAIIGPDTLALANRLNLAPATFLENNDSGGFFRAVGGLLLCGPTGTNVNDFRAILVDPSVGASTGDFEALTARR